MAKLTNWALNNEVQAWTKTTAALAKKKMRDLGIGAGTDPGQGIAKFRGTVKADQWGDANSIGFGMKKYMVFVHKGVGRGYPISKVLKGPVPGKTVRFEKPFLNPILDQRVPELADTVQKYIADATVRGFEIK